MRGGRFVVAVAAALICAAYGSFAAPVRIDAKAGESLVAVRDRVRALPASEKANGVEVVLAEGEYLLLDGLELTVTDSGASAAAPVVWRSEKPGAARIVGSRRISASLFKKVVNPQFLARIPEEGRGKVYAADVSAVCPNAVTNLPDSFLGAPPPPFVFFEKAAEEWLDAKSSDSRYVILALWSMVHGLAQMVTINGVVDTEHLENEIGSIMRSVRIVEN